jgi:hypothetical protein
LSLNACSLFPRKIATKDDFTQEGRSIQELIETFNDAIRVWMKLLFILWKKIKK